MARMDGWMRCGRARGLISGRLARSRRRRRRRRRAAEVEKETKEELTTLKDEIEQLRLEVKQGAGSSVQQENKLRELTRQRDDLVRERDAAAHQVMTVRNDITDLGERLKLVEADKATADQAVIDIRKEIEQKKTETDGFKKKKEREEAEKAASAASKADTDGAGKAADADAAKNSAPPPLDTNTPSPPPPPPKKKMKKKSDGSSKKTKSQKKEEL